MAISPARRVAFDILRKVEGGGYASDLLAPPGAGRACPAPAGAAGLEARDAGLASEIVFGVLRY